MASGSKQTTTTKTSGTSSTTPVIPSWEQQPFQNFYQGVSNLAATPATSFTTPATASQQLAFGRAGNAGSPYASTFQNVTGYQAPQVSAGQLSSTDLSPYMNPFQQQVIDATLGEFGQGNAIGLNQIRGSTPSGAFGGSRQGVAEGQLTSDNLRTLASTLAGLNSQNFSQAQGAAGQDISSRLQADLANQGADQSAAGLRLAAAGAGADNARADVNQALDAGSQERAINSQNNPNVAQSQLLQLIQSLLGQNPAMYAGTSGTMQGKNVSTTTSDPGVLGALGTLLGGIGDLGSAGAIKFSNPFVVSDRRLKTDTRLLGEDAHGNRWWEFRYMWDAPQVRHVGVMADEAPPEAVATHPSGFLMVDYSKLRGAA